MDRKDFKSPTYILPTSADEAFVRDVMSQLHLPVDHFTLAKVQIDAAAKFITGSPDDYHPEDEAELKKGLLALISATPDNIQITCNSELPKIDEYVRVQYLWYALQIRSVSLLLRHAIFGDPADLEMYHDQHKYLGPWDESGRDLFVHACYQAYRRDTRNSRSQQIISGAPTGVHMAELKVGAEKDLVVTHVYQSFLDFVQHTLGVSEELQGTPAETRDPTRQSQVVASLSTIIETLDHIVVHRAEGHSIDPLLWKSFVQGVSYFHRFIFLENIADLNSSILLLENAVSSCDSQKPESVSQISTEALRAISARYDHTKDPIDLDHFIRIAEGYLSLPQTTGGRIAISKLLSDRLVLRLRIRCSAEDVCRVLQLCEEILSTASGEQHSEYLLIAEQAVASVSRVVESSLLRSSPATPDDLVAILDNMADTFSARRLSCSPGGHQQAATLILVVILTGRYAHSHLIQDLRDAVEYRTSLDSQPLGTFCFDLYLLQASLQDRDPVRTGQRLVEARKLHWLASRSPRAVCRCPKNQIPQGYEGSGLQTANLKLPRLQRVHGRDRVQIVPSTTPILDRAQILSSFDIDRFMLNATAQSELDLYRTNLLHQIYDRREGTGSQQLPEGCKSEEENLKQLYDSLQGTDQSYGARHWRKDWAQALLSSTAHRYAVPFSGAPLSRHHLALDYLREFAYDHLHAPLNERLVALNFWFKELLRVRHEKKGQVFDMGELTLSLLQEQSEAATNTQDSIDTRLWTQGLLLEVVAEAALAETKMEGAVGLLLWGQSIVRNQLTKAPEALRTKGSAIKDEPLRDRLEVDSREKKPTQNHETPRIQRLLESTLLWEQLKEIGRYGPVVVLVPGVPHSIAIIFSPLFSILSRCILPISSAEVNVLHEALQFSVKSRGSHDQPSQSDTADPKDISEPPMHFGNLNESDMRSLRRKLKSTDTSVDTVLERLWVAVVKPVYQSGLVGERNADGEIITTLMKPPLQKRTRIWWCCLGEFSFLPVHAAGIYTGASPTCASDFFVSSYIPSLEALIDARKRPHLARNEYKVLAAIQPRPGHGWSYLPGVRSELEEVLKVVPERNLVRLGDSKGPDLEGIHTTVENLVEKLPEANILHLACHGTQDVNNPLKSGFVLANGQRLTIEELSKLQLPNAHTAILSACHTASNDVAQPEESINLTNAMLSLGFRNILATKWPMSDADGPFMAKTVYSTLTNWSNGAAIHPLMRPQDFSVIFEDVYISIRSGQLDLLPSKSMNDRWDLRRNLTQHFFHSLRSRDGTPNSYEAFVGAVRGGFALMSPEPVLESEVKAAVDAMTKEFFAPSLAHFIDEIARDLRINRKLPAARWATFVHFGA